MQDSEVGSSSAVSRNRKEAGGAGSHGGVWVEEGQDLA